MKKSTTKKNGNDKTPCMVFYAMDWLTDVELRSCSAEARALWIDLLCYMSLSRIRGKLVIADRPMTLEDIKRMTQMTDPEFDPIFNELIERNVLRKDDEGFYYSRRVMEDEKVRQLRKKSGKMGGLKAEKNRVAKTVAKKEQDVDQNAAFPISYILYPNKYNNSIIFWIKSELKKVSKLPKQLTEEQELSLINDFGTDAVVEVLLAMENKPDLTKKYESVYLTARNWLKRRQDDKPNDNHKNGSPVAGSTGKSDNAAAISQF